MAVTIDDDGTAHETDAPIDLIETLFEARGWAHERIGEEEIVAEVAGGWSRYEVRALWRDEDRVLQLMALPEIRVPADQRGALYEAIGLINEQLWLGHFELWSASGLLLYRNAALLDGDEPALGESQAEVLIETALDEWERYYPVFQFVLWGGKSPAEALAAALVETRGEA